MDFFCGDAADLAARSAGAYPRHREMLHSLGSIRYCRSELYQDCVPGILRLPRKSTGNIPLATFGFYLAEGCLTLIEASGSLKSLMEKARARHSGPLSPGQLLLFLFESMMEGDVLYLQHLEEKMDALEEQLLHRTPDRFQETLIGFRRKLSELHAYYKPLSDIGDTLGSEECQALRCLLRQLAALHRPDGPPPQLCASAARICPPAPGALSVPAGRPPEQDHDHSHRGHHPLSPPHPSHRVVRHEFCQHARAALGVRLRGAVIGLALLIVVLEIVYFKRKKML